MTSNVSIQDLVLTN